MTRTESPAPGGSDEELARVSEILKGMHEYVVMMPFSNSRGQLEQWQRQMLEMVRAALGLPDKVS